MTLDLEDLRRQIDHIDDRLVSLLIERTKVVEQVGILKDRTAPGVCPIRPGREASMVRRLAQKFSNTPFPPAAAAAIWRSIIGASTCIESDLKIAVYTPDKENDLFWLAREYFGPATQIICEPHTNRVIGQVIDGKAQVGILPMLRGSDTQGWWTGLIQSDKDTPKIFAHIPFITSATQNRDVPSALAIARIAPEDSGDDTSIWVLETEHNVSQSRLQKEFADAGLEAHVITIATPAPNARQHVVAIKGFITPENAGMLSVMASLGIPVRQSAWLGSYGTPVQLSAKERRHETATA